MSKIRFFMFIFLFFAVINASIFAYAEENVILSKVRLFMFPQIPIFTLATVKGLSF